MKWKDILNKNLVNWDGLEFISCEETNLPDGGIAYNMRDILLEEAIVIRDKHSCGFVSDQAILKRQESYLEAINAFTDIDAEKEFKALPQRERIILGAMFRKLQEMFLYKAEFANEYTKDLDDPENRVKLADMFYQSRKDFFREVFGRDDVAEEDAPENLPKDYCDAIQSCQEIVESQASAAGAYDFCAQKIGLIANDAGIKLNSPGLPPL